MASLQERQRWFTPKKNMAIGDVVLLVDNAPRNSWALGRVVHVTDDKKGLARIVRVKTKSNELCRAVHKLCSILEADPQTN